MKKQSALSSISWKCANQLQWKKIFNYAKSAFCASTFFAAKGRVTAAQNCDIFKNSFLIEKEQAESQKEYRI